jgi:uncharacterized protein (TIGR03083 family)
VTLPRAEVIPGLQDEYGRFEELVRSLSAEQLAAPTRCEGWTAGDVAAHVIGTISDITAGRFDGIGSPEATQRAVDERKGRTGAALGEELQQSMKLAKDLLLALDNDDAWSGPAPGDLGIPLSEGVEALWYDAFLHSQDIRAAIGQAAQPGPGLRASVSHVADLLTRNKWGPATLALEGQDEFPISGGGERITGDALDFVLVATGRHDPSTFGLDETVNIYR